MHNTVKAGLFALVLACAVPSWAAITQTGHCEAATTSCTLSAVNSGDLILVVAHRNASNTAPSLPAGNTNIFNAALTGSGTTSMRAYCRKASSSADTGTGTATNATGIMAVALSGTSIQNTADCATSAIGAFVGTKGGAASTTQAYTTISMLDKTNSSWVFGFSGVSVASSCTPSGMTSIGTAGAGPTVLSSSTNATVTSWPTTNCTISSGTWATFDVEVLAPHTSGTPSMVSWANGPMADNGTTSTGAWRARFPNPGTLSGNLVILCGNTNPGQGTITVTDDQSNTWYNGPTAAGGQTAWCSYAPNAASGTRVLSVNFGAATDFTQLAVYQFSGVYPGGALDVSSTGTGTSTAPACSAMTTAFSGDLIFHYAESEGNTTASWTKGSAGSLTWNLMGASLGKGMSAEYAIQSSAGSITPAMTQGTSTGWGSVCMAFKGATQGNTPVAGIHIVGTQHETFVAGHSATINLQLPTQGNLFVNMWSGASGDAINSMSTTSNTWTQAGSKIDSGDSVEQAFYVAGATPSNSMTITSTQNQTLAGDDTYVLYDIAGAATSPYDSTAGHVTATPLRGDALPFTALSITPSTSNGLVFCSMGIAHNTVSGTNSGVMLLDAWDFDGENGFASPYDENNGWAEYNNPSTSSVACSWSFASGVDVVGQTAAQAVAFEAPGASTTIDSSNGGAIF